MKMEYMHACLPADQNLQTAMQTLVSQGWQLIQGVVPVCVYYLQRPDTAHTEHALELKMSIDDSKIHIIRGGNGSE
jgi:hypothetical protein